MLSLLQNYVNIGQQYKTVIYEYKKITKNINVCTFAELKKIEIELEKQIFNNYNVMYCTFFRKKNIQVIETMCFNYFDYCTIIM